MSKYCLFIYSVILLALAITAVGKTVNLVPNPGFETVNNGKIVSWKLGKRLLSGTIGVSSNEKHRGNYSGYIKSDEQKLDVNARPYGSIAFTTADLPSPPAGTEIQFSAWIKTKNIISPGKWFKCRFVVYFFDSNKKRLKHYDLASLTGTLAWKQYKVSMRVPENAAFMRLSCSMTHCTGEVWFDDIKARVDETTSPSRKQAMTKLIIDRPILIPAPMKVTFHKNKIVLGSVSLKTIPSDKIFNGALFDLMQRYNIKVAGGQKIEIICCDKNNKIVQPIFKTEFPQYKWQDMGSQGYFVVIKNNRIILGGNSEQARFYALQTLSQLLRRYNGKALDTVTVIDRPTISKRGVVVGLQWFRKKEEVVKRMAQMKMNLVFHHGSFLNLKLGGGNHKSLKDFWRKDFSKAELNLVKNYVELCRKNFIEVCFSFTPRGLPQTHYSSSKDIKLLAAKMIALYNVGVLCLDISFDDLQNIEQDVLFYPDDIKKFNNNLGRAHAYFVDNVYKIVKKNCPDVVLATLPYAYGGLGQMPEKGKRSKDYLRAFSKGLSPGIAWWVACLYSLDDITESHEITGYKPFIWDNFYTTGKLPAFPNPISRSAELSDSNISGYIFLPASPRNEDASKISWLNAADYMWSPARYEPMKSYSNAIAYVAGKTDAIKLVEDYSRFSLKIDDYKFPTASKAKRLAFLNQTLAKLSSYPAKLTVLPPVLSKAINKDILKYKKDLNNIITNLQQRPYPVLVQSKTKFIPTEQNALKNFIPLKPEKKLEDTKVWFSYDAEMLYIKVVCDEDNMKKLVARRRPKDSRTFLDDSVEFFIMPEGEDALGNSTYYQIAVNSKGSIFDSKYVHKRFNYLRDQYLDWSANCEIKNKINHNSWELEISIPFSALGMNAPAKGQRIFFNVCRNRYAGKPAKYSCYAFLLKGSFHDPASFWPMQFE